MSQHAPSPILGIDLGTTMSACGVFIDGEVRLVPNDLDALLTPSVVAYDARAKGLVVGRVAKDILAQDPRLAVGNFKRAMGSDQVFELDGDTYTAPELSSYVLDALRADAERMLDQPVSRCVITVPAYFGEAQRHATSKAGELAGLEVIRILNEPTAAAISYGRHRGEDERTFLVLDLGGGTFDACVMSLFEGLLEVRSVAGESQLGGEDFTESIRTLALGKAGVTMTALEPEQRAKLNKRSELLKRKLARWPAAEILVPVPGGADDVSVPITQSDADQAYAPLLERMLAPCRSALRGATTTPDDLQDVLLVGGATRMRCVGKLALDLFGREPETQTEPDLVVVRGAAIQAALCADDESVGDMVVTDVASHSLGINVNRELDGQAINGFFCPIIDRNTVIPTSRTETFSTTSGNQEELLVEVYEGENRRCVANRRLGTLSVQGLPPGEPRDAVTIRFTYDLSGILEVEATVIETGTRTSGIFRRDGRQIRGEALEAAKSRLRLLKADPSERPRYRDLLSRANGLWSDLKGDSRELLAYRMDHFEAALASRTPATIEKTYEALKGACHDLDGGERW